MRRRMIKRIVGAIMFLTGGIVAVCNITLNIALAIDINNMVSKIVYSTMFFPPISTTLVIVGYILMEYDGNEK